MLKRNSIFNKTLLIQSEKAIDFYEGKLKLSKKIGFEWALNAAMAGDPRNMVNVAYSYSEGIYVEKSFEKSILWLSKATKYNIPTAFYNLALHYEKGDGVRVNTKKAFQLYKKSADLGYGEGMVATGWCYEHGSGVKQDFKKASIYYGQAVQMNEALAFYNLGLLYLEGEGVSQSTSKALKLLSDEKLNNHLGAKECLVEIFTGASSVTKKFKNLKMVNKYLEEINRLKKR